MSVLFFSFRTALFTCHSIRKHKRHSAHSVTPRKKEECRIKLFVVLKNNLCKIQNSNRLPPSVKAVICQLIETPEKTGRNQKPKNTVYTVFAFGSETRASVQLSSRNSQLICHPERVGKVDPFPIFFKKGKRTKGGEPVTSMCELVFIKNPFSRQVPLSEKIQYKKDLEPLSSRCFKIVLRSAWVKTTGEGTGGG